MLVVAYVNDRTCCMLIRAAAYTGKDTYESLTEWAGGQPAKVGLAGGPVAGGQAAKA